MRGEEDEFQNPQTLRGGESGELLVGELNNEHKMEPR
jgi:hypothetical protein